MYRGIKQLGEEVPLGVLCRSTSGVPADPDACPRVDVYGPSGQVVAGRGVPILDPAATTGLFQGRIFLDETYGVGTFLVVYRWASSGTPLCETDTFEVAAGGGASGAVIAIYNYERPHANHLVQHRTAGRLYKGKNPRL